MPSERCQFCHSTKDLHTIENITLCQRCALAIFNALNEKKPQEKKKEKEKFYFVN